MQSPVAPKQRRFRRAFSMVEILVATAIMGVLAALLMSGMKGAANKGKEAKCISNLRQIGVGMMTYAAENDGCLPRATIDSNDPDAPINPATGQKITGDYMWSKQLGPYLPQRGNSESLTGQQNRVFICPAANYAGYANSAISSSYNCTSTLYYFDDLGNASDNGLQKKPYYSGRKLVSVQNPGKTILVAEGKLAVGATSGACTSAVPWSKASVDFQKANIGATIFLDYRHNEKMNVAYADGHVGTLPFKERSQVVRGNWEGRLYP